MRLTVLAAAATLAMAACSQPAESPAEAPAAAKVSTLLAGVDLTKPVRVGGNEPFWSVELTGAEMIYSGVDRPEQRAPQPAATVQGTVATFESTTATGNPLKVTLTTAACSDGMSDREYPLSAMVVIGEESLTGCAASASAFANSGESGLVVDEVQPAG